MIFKAIEFAAAAHRGQYRKGTLVPYIVHPLNAARTLIESGCTEAIAVAAVLHDVVEDTAVTLREVRANFGAEVAALVEGASEPHRWASWESRKEHTIATLREAQEPLLMVAIADKLDNIQSIRHDLALRGEAAWLRFKRGREKQQWYYQSLAQVFTERLTSGPGLRLAQLFAAEVAAVFPAL